MSVYAWHIGNHETMYNLGIYSLHLKDIMAILNHETMYNLGIYSLHLKDIIVIMDASQTFDT